MIAGGIVGIALVLGTFIIAPAILGSFCALYASWGAALTTSCFVLNGGVLLFDSWMLKKYKKEVN